MHKRTLTASLIAAVLLSNLTVAAVGRMSASRPPRPERSAGSTALSSRPDRTDWEKIKNAAHLRTLALAPHRTVHFRTFAAFLGLSELASVHPLAPGRCLTAVIYLHNNLLDLENAYPGENWNPLRRAVEKEPSIQACAPRRETAARPFSG